MTWTLLWTVITTMHEALVVLAVVAVLRRPREPRAMWAWILTLVALPFLGLVLFVLLGEPRIRRTQRRRRRRRLKVRQTLRSRVGDSHAGRSARATAVSDAAAASLMRVASQVSQMPPTRHNAVVVYHEADKTFLDLSLAIRAARAHIHFEYYIFQPDETGTAIRDLLIAKAREGVQCRVLLDSIGCWNLSRSFLRPMRDAGVEVDFFLPVIPWRGRWRVNFRNHRKIVVIDGQIGFTGSQNIGNEYAGRRCGLGPWRDTHMRIVGPAVHHLQEVFIEDWHFTTGQDITRDVYFPTPASTGDQLIQVIPSGPDQEANVLQPLLIAAMGAARETLCITTPYFVPDAAMLFGLQAAAYRGVQVRLLIPTKTDHPVVLWAGRSYYNELRRAGVEIFEYAHGMLHSKVLVIDDTCAIVGSANIDERSLRLNFELSMMLYDQYLARQLRADFDELVTRARAIRHRHRRSFTFGESVKLGLARLASPLL